MADTLFELAFDKVLIYSEADDGTVLNCSPVPGGVDGVPLQGVTGSHTVTDDFAIGSGQLVGCMPRSEVETLCSCVGECGVTPHEACGPCPTGSVPLVDMLGDIVETDNCSSKLGEPAFDLHANFTSTRIPFPPFCE